MALSEALRKQDLETIINMAKASAIARRSGDDSMASEHRRDAYAIARQHGEHANELIDAYAAAFKAEWERTKPATRLL